MKAIVYHQYGTSDMLKLKEVEKPVQGDDEVLIKVRAASVNSWDWDLLRGKPFLARIGGVFKPRYKILGADVAGTVEAVGKDVKKFQPGDEVFGDLCECGWGGFAEYTSARENALTLKPVGITFEQAAAIPQAGVLALQGLRDNRPVEQGQRILINGAAGGVGTFAIQMAKLWGAEVTGVDHTSKLNLMKSLGVDHVVDYTREDFTKIEEHYDLILDVIGRHSIFDYKRILNPNGIYAMIGGATNRIFQLMLLGPIISKTGNKKMGIVIHKPNKDLDFIKELVETGKVKPVIDKCYPLSETAEALSHLGEGRVKGKVVVIV